MIKDINNNGYEYVDLELPSRTLWAEKNVGADKPSDYGLYFQWGGTQGYTANQVGTDEGKKKFASDFSYYKWYDTNKKAFTKYTTTGATLDLEDDAAYVNMGGSWHIPTPEQIKELLSNTTNTWTKQDGVKGRLFTSKKETSKSIFIPAAGEIRLGGSVCFIGFVGEIWSSMLSADSIYGAQRLSFSSKDAGLYTYLYRYYGLSVRGVIG